MESNCSFSNDFLGKINARTRTINSTNEHNIDMVILKGAAASIYYPRPDLRVMGDIDFFVHPQKFQKTYQILLENGY